LRLKNKVTVSKDNNEPSRLTGWLFLWLIEGGAGWPAARIEITIFHPGRTPLQVEFVLPEYGY
jgi:hypothetical protein